MTSKKPSSSTKIIFFGTGQTSLEALQALHEQFDIGLVVTKPPAPNSAGKASSNAVERWSKANNLKIITPDGKKELERAFEGIDTKNALGIVLDYGVIIPGSVIDRFPRGILNSHFSLLPKYRGADPIRSAILGGDDETGVTIIKITPRLDAGPMLTWAQVDINGTDALELRAKLSEVNCALLAETVRLYLAGRLELVGQDEAEASHTRKTTKEDGLINPAKTAGELYRELRAYAGWPKSYMEYNGKPLIIIEASASDIQAPPGQLQAVEGNLHLGCKDGSLLIKTLQPAGKAAMDAKAFINGYLR